MAYQLSYICKILTIKLFYGRSNESRLPIEMPWGTFQSTHPRGVWPRWLGRETSLRSFNPRTYERCDLSYEDWLAVRKVSIHAPTRGATILNLNGDWFLVVSIHAPTRGATYRKWDRRIQSRFQSTHLREVRPAWINKDAKEELFQSTHLREVRLVWEVDSVT